jgi:hypothetical protein
VKQARAKIADSFTLKGTDSLALQDNRDKLNVLGLLANRSSDSFTLIQNKLL